MIKYNDFIFRDYDIRGIYGIDFDESFAYNLGISTGIYVKGGTIVVGHDFRVGSESLSDSFITGAVYSGCDVIDIGAVPVPLLYYATKHLSASIGTMITASHLPAGWNGFKFCDQNGLPISFDSGLKSIRNLIGNNKKSFKKGSVKHYNILDSYVDYITQLLKIHKPLKVVFDYGDSVTSLIVPRIARKLCIEFYEIHNSISGDFPNRTSELTPLSMAKLKETVIQTKADIGIAYDGDGDRMGLVDQNGIIYYSGDKVIQLLCTLLSTSIKGNSVIYDLTCSKAVKEVILNLGGKPIESKVGQAHIASLAISNKAIFGGQYSCHTCFKETGYIDDALYSSFKILDLLSHQEYSLADIAKSLLEYPHSEIENVPVQEQRKGFVIMRVEAEMIERGYKVNRLDGIKIESEDCWCLIRPSNTSPVIRINVEGKKLEEVLQFHKLCSDIVKEAIRDD